MLLSTLSPDVQDRVLTEWLAELRPISTPRAGDVLGTIVRLLPRQKDWTVDDLKKRIVEAGVGASSKEVYNAVGYLTRKGHIRRVGYGRYVVDGMEVITSDDFGGPNTRHEDAYRVNREEEP